MVILNSTQCVRQWLEETACRPGCSFNYGRAGPAAPCRADAAVTRLPVGVTYRHRSGQAAVIDRRSTNRRSQIQTRVDQDRAVTLAGRSVGGVYSPPFPGSLWQISSVSVLNSPLLHLRFQPVPGLACSHSQRTDRDLSGRAAPVGPLHHRPSADCPEPFCSSPHPDGPSASHHRAEICGDSPAAHHQGKTDRKPVPSHATPNSRAGGAAG